MGEIEVEPVGEVRAGLGESPRFDAESGELLWVDIPGGLLHRTDPATGATTSLAFAPPLSSVNLATGGGLVLTFKNCIVLRGTDGAQRTLAEIDDRPGFRFNDAACDPRGRLWAGTMNMARTPGTAALYRLDAARGVADVVTAATVSNGLGWSPDGRLMYYADTPTLRVDCFDYDPGAGQATGRRVLADTGGHPGRPDGLAVDADGCVWVALNTGGALHRYTPGGRLDRVVTLPVSHPTSCAFGGPGLRELYVTTACEDLPEAERAAQPLAGRLLRLLPGVGGLPAHRYRPTG